MTTTVNGWTSFWKNVMSCGFPLSRIVNSSRSSIGHEASLRVGDGGHDGDDPRARPERRLLRRLRRQGRQPAQPTTTRYQDNGTHMGELSNDCSAE